jgi:hypothetical protein
MSRRKFLIHVELAEVSYGHSVAVRAYLRNVRFARKPELILLVVSPPHDKGDNRRLAVRTLVLFLQHQTPALVVIQAELFGRRRFGRGAIRRIDFTKIFYAPFENRRSPSTYVDFFDRRFHG